MVAQWINFRVDDLDEKTFIFLRGFPGSSKQRRKSLRAKLRELSKGRDLKVTKRTWRKGESSMTAINVWTKTIKPT
jgi:hypothetical protein